MRNVKKTYVPAHSKHWALSFIVHYPRQEKKGHNALWFLVCLSEQMNDLTQTNILFFCWMRMDGQWTIFFPTISPVAGSLRAISATPGRGNSSTSYYINLSGEVPAQIDSDHKFIVHSTESTPTKIINNMWLTSGTHKIITRETRVCLSKILNTLIFEGHEWILNSGISIAIVNAVPNLFRYTIKECLQKRKWRVCTLFTFRLRNINV